MPNEINYKYTNIGNKNIKDIINVKSYTLPFKCRQ